jgi:rhodanese-related sulfurtransferase
MSNITVSSLPRLRANSLRDLILSSSPTSSQPTSTSDTIPPPSRTSSNLAIIDVRDGDYIGGHIAGSQHVPSSTIDYAMPELVRTLKEKKVVVFHCMLSQQRGPSAALRYVREREKLVGQVTKAGEGNAEGAKDEDRQQKVYVLERGFQGWQEQYGEDERLTEGYVKDIWE